jgi:cytochrome c-type biogenesis protein CcmE
MTSFEDAAVYSKSVDQLVAEQDKLVDRNVRVTGTLVRGSLTKRDEPCEYRFKIQKNTKELPVRFAQCIVPDTFRDVPGMDVEVTAEGKLQGEGHFEATQIMAKCPSKYEMQQKAAKGEKAPHQDVPAAMQN